MKRLVRRLRRFLASWRPMSNAPDIPGDPKRPKPPPRGIDALGDLFEEISTLAHAGETDLERDKREVAEAYDERMSIPPLEDHSFMVEFARAQGWSAEQLVSEVYPNMTKQLSKKLLAGLVTIDCHGRLHNVH